jgi:hypothetical protein
MTDEKPGPEVYEAARTAIQEPGFMPMPQRCKHGQRECPKGRDEEEREELHAIALMGTRYLIDQCERASVLPYITDPVILAKMQSLLELPQ